MELKHPGNIIVFESTYRCNGTCPNCFTGSPSRESENGEELSTEEITTLILDKAQDLKILNMVWSGGEFLMRKDALQLIKEARKRGLLNVILTNGILLNEKKLFELKKAAGNCLILGIGIDSIDENVNIKTRGQDPQEILQLLKLCDKLGIGYWINITISRATIGSLEKTFEFFDSNNIYFNRVPYTGRGHGFKDINSLAFTTEEMKEKIHPLLRKHTLSYTSFVPFFVDPELVDQNRISTKPSANFLAFGCFVGSSIIISPKGGVGFCGLIMEHVEAGNVRETPLDLIVFGEKYQRHINRENYKGKCKICRYRETCGGCRATAYWYSGDYFNEDPTCFFEPEDETTVCELEEEMNEKFKEHIGFYNHNAYVVVYHELKKRMPAIMAKLIIKTLGINRILKLKEKFEFTTI